VGRLLEGHLSTFKVQEGQFSISRSPNFFDNKNISLISVLRLLPLAIRRVGVGVGERPNKQDDAVAIDETN